VGGPVRYELHGRFIALALVTAAASRFGTVRRCDQTVIHQLSNHNEIAVLVERDPGVH
jgi:hypothetical protein